MPLTIPLHYKFAFLVMLLSSLLSTAVQANTGNTTYVELTPDFIVNHLDTSGQLRYIKTSITLRTEQSQRAIIMHNMPLIRDALVMFLSSRTSEQVSGALAREETRQSAALVINEAMMEETGRSPVTDLLFSSFVTQ